MRHLRSVTHPAAHPGEATSLLVVQQKIASFAAFATALNAFGGAISTFMGMANEKGNDA